MIHYTDYITETGIQFFKIATQNQLEAIVAKNKNSIYKENTRSRSWLKIKSKYKINAVIGGFTEPREGRKHFGAILLGVYQDKQLKYIGSCGTGFSDKDQLLLIKKFKNHMTQSCPFTKTPKTNTSPTWLIPQLSCEITFTEWTKNGIMRMPVFVGLRE